MWGAWGQVEGAPVLATGGQDGTVRVWHVEAPEADTELIRYTVDDDPAGPAGRVLWGAWAQVEGAPMLATGFGYGTVWLWNLAYGTTSSIVLFASSQRKLWGAWGQVEGAPALASGGEAGTVDVSWNLEGPEPGGMTMHPADGMPAGPSGRMLWGAWGRVDDVPALATGGEDGTVRLWNLATRSLRSVLTGHSGPVLWGAWAQVEGAPVLATGGEDGMVRLWDPDTGSQRGVALASHTGPLPWGARGQVGGAPVLATGGEDGTVRLWNLATGSLRSVTAGCEASGQNPKRPLIHPGA